MGRMYGADADELDRLAGELGRLGDRLDRSRATLGSQIHSAPWHGPGADDFRRRWNGEYRQIFGSACTLLESGGDVLRRNADEQRRASEAGGGARPSVSSTPSSSGAPQWLKEIDEALDALGLSVEARKAVLEMLAALDPALAKELGGLIKGLKALGHVIDVVTFVVDFASDMVAHPELPIDERLVHAITYAALPFAASKGIEALAMMAGASIGAAAGGVGAIPGAAVGKAIGIGLGFVGGLAFDYADDKVGISEKGADVALEYYRVQKAVAGATIGVATSVVTITVDVAENLAEGAADVANATIDYVEDKWPF